MFLANIELWVNNLGKTFNQETFTFVKDISRGVILI